MKMVVGLGNYGPDFSDTRHNVGFDTLDSIAGSSMWVEIYNCMVMDIKKFNMLLVKPKAGMNVCGADVERVRLDYDIPIEDVIVVHDEMDFEPGQIKVKFSGGDGKHNGLKTLIQHMGPNFARVRIGIGKPKGKGIDFVLGTFPKHERKLVDEAITEAVAAVNIITRENVQSAMAFFNQKKEK